MLRKTKSWIKVAFHFSNRESNGLLAIIVLILLLVIAPKVYTLYQRSIYKPLDHSEDIALLEKNLTLLKANATKSVPININSATAAQLQQIAGITEQLALRVIRYRGKLGGFISTDQYKEVYRLSSGLQVRLEQCTTIPRQYIPKKISLNQATFQTLVRHPYISVAMAKAIIAYRKKQGKFTNLSAIQKLPGYHPDWGRKIMSYLSL